MKARWIIWVLLFPALGLAAETRVLKATLTNTTHDVSAAATFELVIDGDKVTGWLTTEKPLAPGRWPLTGTHKGAWMEVTCKQTPETATVFRGVLSDGEFRGTYLFGGGGELVQYGRFQAKAATLPEGIKP